MVLMRRLLIFSLLLSAWANAAQHTIVNLDSQPLHLTYWGNIEDEKLPAVVLLSGPIDTWHSDSAWWASIGDQLSQTHRVLAPDRAGIATENRSAKLGYVPFAEDLNQLFSRYQIKNATVVAFASSNITLMQYFAKYPQQHAIKAVIMIDPDVLTDFSIARYTNDAQPFVDNLDKYLTYIGEEKYIPRVEQKNAAEIEQIKKLLSNESNVDWPHIEHMQKQRLKVLHQQNLFKEIAIYGQELAAVKSLIWPKSIPLTIIDTQFESDYIDNTTEEEAKSGLIKWQNDAKQYYQDLVTHSKMGKYLESESRAHLIQFEQPQLLLSLIAEKVSD